ncbi:MAG: M48 family metallopeptidase [Clostridia bacterium]|nr:M48 family metallopeptidase [Clostridia bacterium]
MFVLKPDEYTHPKDQSTLNELKAVPGFTAILRAFMKNFTEKTLHGMNMANKIRLGRDQLPGLYAFLAPLCETLGVEEIPELYLEQTPAVNAYTQGDSIVSITLTSGLVEAMTDLQIRAVLAHEVAHVACHHVLYHTLGDLLLTAGSDLLGLGGLLTAPLRLPLYQWLRMSELSCDRAAALCLGDPQPMLEALMILAGGKESRFGPLSLNSYIRQAESYAKEADESLLSKGLQYISVVGQSHPFLSMRVSELITFSESDRYKQLMKRYEMAHTPISVPHKG